MDIEEVWTNYRTGIKGFLHSRVSDPDEVDDLLQEILIRTHKSLGSVRSEESVKAWLYQVANNAVIDFYRRRGKSPALTADDLWYGEDPETAGQGLARCVEPFINALPIETAELLRAVDIEGVSQKEYAADYGISYSTLKSRVQKGRQELRKVFEQCCEFSLDQHGNIVDYNPKSTTCRNC